MSVKKKRCKGEQEKDGSRRTFDELPNVVRGRSKATFYASVELGPTQSPKPIVALGHMWVNMQDLINWMPG